MLAAHGGDLFFHQLHAPVSVLPQVASFYEGQSLGGVRIEDFNHMMSAITLKYSDSIDAQDQRVFIKVPAKTTNYGGLSLLAGGSGAVGSGGTSSGGSSGSSASGDTGETEMVRVVTSEVLEERTSYFPLYWDQTLLYDSMETPLDSRGTIGELFVAFSARFQRSPLSIFQKKQCVEGLNKMHSISTNNDPSFFPRLSEVDRLAQYRRYIEEFNKYVIAHSKQSRTHAEVAARLPELWDFLPPFTPSKKEGKNAKESSESSSRPRESSVAPDAQKFRYYPQYNFDQNDRNPVERSDGVTKEARQVEPHYVDKVKREQLETPLLSTLSSTSLYRRFWGDDGVSGGSDGGESLGTVRGAGGAVQFDGYDSEGDGGEVDAMDIG
eukprot:TRINITY_DN12577_c0_g1_i1.p1 TRINITY_DN12577_c0_g1~~TRINITY_DN12577_c0_g1_i1.p1  ORF type:complete len:435 (+),score=79.29 TRINITY_DN12577_c0_g1_i1:163-1305(+)